MATPLVAELEARETAYGVADSLLASVDSLPTLADVPMRVLQLLESDDVSIDAVVRKLELDPILASRVVRLANSPLFGASQRVDTIGKAVLRLGLRELRTAMVTVAFIDSVGCDSRTLDMREIFRESVCCGSIARRLATDLGRAEPGLAYLAGLLHAIGEIVLALRFTDRFERVVHQARRLLVPIGDLLERELGVAPSVLGARLLARWHMPDPVIDAVEHQHAPERSPHADTLADLLGSARKTVRALGIGIEWPGDSLRDWTSEALPILGRAERDGDALKYLQARRDEVGALGPTLAQLLPPTRQRTALLS